MPDRRVLKGVDGDRGVGLVRKVGTEGPQGHSRASKKGGDDGTPAPLEG